MTKELDDGPSIIHIGTNGNIQWKPTNESFVNYAFDSYLDDLKQQNLNLENEEKTKEPEKLPESKQSDSERPTWGNSLEFLMSCISLSVGLGNIWRFPFTAYENGGGAFLIPYIIVLVIIGRPMYYLEMVLGQFTGQSSIKIWNSVPLLKGVGIGQLIGTFCIVTYYVSLIALTLSYMISSFASELPWATCREEWGPNCINSSIISVGNESLSNNISQSVSSSELYFLKEILKEKNDISDGIGWPDWKLSLWLLLAWVIIFLVLVKGIKSHGKASYFLALFPYVVIIILLIRALTLEGAVDGIIFFITPQWEQLLNPKVWYAATSQLFFSLSVGQGTIIMFSSYNDFRHNIYRDAMIVTTMDTFTSFLAGMTIFSILGNLAHNLGIKDISQVVKSGTGLAFISYPDTIAKFTVVPQLFSVLFFFMLLVLGVGSAVALHAAISTAIWDKFPKIPYWRVALALSIVGYLCGLLYVTPGGQWMLNLIDYYGGTFLIFLLAIVEMIGILWIYGLENFCHDIEYMSKRHVTVYWRLCWTIITPVFMIIVFIYSLVEYKWLTYGDLSYPTSAQAAGVMVLLVGVFQVLLWVCWLLYRGKTVDTSYLDIIKKNLRPNSNWGPKSLVNKTEWMEYKRKAEDQRKLMAKKLNHGYFKEKVWILLGKYSDYNIQD